MRIVIWTDAFWPEIGGLEVFCLRLSTALKQRGHTCLIVANAPLTISERQVDHGGIPVHRFAFWDTMGTGNLKDFRSEIDACNRVVEDFAPDAIHLNAINKSLMAFVLQQRNKPWPTLLTLHDNLLFRNRNAIGRTTLQSVNLIAAVSESIRQNALSYMPELAGRLHTVPNSLPQPSTPYAPFPNDVRLLGFGRIVADKGFDLAIQAFMQIADRFPSVNLTLAGDGDQRAYLESFVQKAGLGHRVHFPGWIQPDDIPQLIARHSLVIMPSRWKEPFGLAALQTAQMGRPIIASRTGGIPEIVVDGVTGRLFENENISELTKVLEEMLKSPERCEEMGKQASIHARENFDFDLFVARYEELYAKIRESSQKA